MKVALNKPLPSPYSMYLNELLQSRWPSEGWDLCSQGGLLKDGASLRTFTLSLSVTLYSLIHYEMIRPLRIRSVTRKTISFRFSSMTASLPVFCPSLTPVTFPWSFLHYTVYVYVCIHKDTSWTGICMNTGLSFGVRVASFRHRDLFCV